MNRDMLREAVEWGEIPPSHPKIRVLAAAARAVVEAPENEALKILVRGKFRWMVEVPESGEYALVKL